MIVRVTMNASHTMLDQNGFRRAEGGVCESVSICATFLFSNGLLRLLCKDIMVSIVVLLCFSGFLRSFIGNAV
jgi:hypothetical protein